MPTAYPPSPPHDGSSSVELSDFSHDPPPAAAHLERGGGGTAKGFEDDERGTDEGGIGEKEENLHPLEDVDAGTVTLYPCAAITFIEAVEERRAVEQTWGLLDVVITCALYGVAIFLFVVTLASLGVIRPFSFSLLLLYLAMTWAALGGWPVCASLHRGNGPAVDFGFTMRPAHFALGLAYGVACVCVALALAALTIKLLGKFDSNAGELLTSDNFTPAQKVALLCLIAFGAPVVEEVSFRGLVFSALAKSLPRVPGHALLCVFLTALYFAVFHLEPVRLLLLFGVGSVITAARCHTGSITPSIVAHTVLNSIPLLMYLFVPEGEGRTEGSWGWEDALDLVMCACVW